MSAKAGSQSLLHVQNLQAKVNSPDNEVIQILHGVDLEIKAGEIHVLMGTNGSGKSTFANVLMGHPGYEVTDGHIAFDGDEITEAEPEIRARKGMFLAFQYPHAIAGLPVGTFLKHSVEAVRGESVPARVFKKELDSHMKTLDVPKSFLSRSLNEGFSGGEKKRTEMLQMNLLNPKLAILDETDSGLDIDALKLIFSHIKDSHSDERAILVITHYDRVLDVLDPTHVHIMKEGKIVKSGTKELAAKIHDIGFEAVIAEGE